MPLNGQSLPSHEDLASLLLYLQFSPWNWVCVSHRWLYRIEALILVTAIGRESQAPDKKKRLMFGYLGRLAIDVWDRIAQYALTDPTRQDRKQVTWCPRGRCPFSQCDVVCVTVFCMPGSEKLVLLFLTQGIRQASGTIFVIAGSVLGTALCSLVFPLPRGSNGLGSAQVSVRPANWKCALGSDSLCSTGARMQVTGRLNEGGARHSWECYYSTFSAAVLHTREIWTADVDRHILFHNYPPGRRSERLTLLGCFRFALFGKYQQSTCWSKV